MALGDIFRLSIIGTGPQGQQLVNVLHYRHVSGSGDDSGTELIDDWHAQCSGLFDNLFTAESSLIGYETRNLTQTEFGLNYTIAVPVPGVIVGETLPPQSAGVIGWRTGLIGRRRAGRMYTWPGGEGSQSAGVWGAGYLGSMGNFASSCHSVSGTDEWQQVIYSRVIGATPEILVTDVTVADINPNVCTQRRRKAGEGV